MRPAVVLVVSTGLLVALAIGSLCVGAVPISLHGIVSCFGALLGVSETGLGSTERTILMQLRLPRVITACLVGASLGVAGAGFQGLFRNPLADPYVIGASSGAALGVTIAIVLGIQWSLFGLTGNAIAAVVGSVLVVAVVFGIGAVGQNNSALSLLLAGVAISSMVNAIVSLLMFWNDDKVVVILAWVMGSLADNSWNAVRTTAILFVLGLLVLGSLSRQLDAFSLGDVASRSLGLSLGRFRFAVVAGCSVTTAAAVSAAGIIGFVGLIAPHIARSLVGTRHSWLIPTSGSIGALILLSADDVARTITRPSELPVGIVTALLGCPFFLYLLKSRSVSGNATV